MKKIVLLVALWCVTVTAAGQLDLGTRPSEPEMSPLRSGAIFSGHAETGDPQDMIDAGADDAILQHRTSRRGGYVLIIAIDPPQGGATTPEPGSHFYSEGSIVDLIATPAAGYEFINWSGAVADPSSPNTTVTMDSSMTVTAHFKLITFQLTLMVEPLNAGTLTPAAGVHEYAAGEVVTLVATPAAGYRFSTWIGDVADPASSTTSVTMDANKEIVARFEQLTHVLTMRAEPENGGSTDPAIGAHSYAHGTVVNISATPAINWHFLTWQGEVVDAAQINTTVVMDSDKSVTAVFEYTQPMVTLTVSVEPENGGTTSPAVGSHSVRLDSVIALLALANDGYTFEEWSGDVENRASPSTVVRMDAAKAVVAHFKIAGAVMQDELTPTEYALEQNYPNPFNGVTRIRYRLPMRTDIVLEIIDMNGVVKRQLVSGEQGAGVHDVIWDGRDEAGVAVATGVYFYRLSSVGFQKTKKLLLVK